jgi:hypothetical protein
VASVRQTNNDQRGGRSAGWISVPLFDDRIRPRFSEHAEIPRRHFPWDKTEKGARNSGSQDITGMNYSRSPAAVTAE